MNLRAAVSVVLAVVAWDAFMFSAQAESLTKQPTNTFHQRFEQVSADTIAHGERLSAVLGCIGCHKRDLKGEDWSDPDYGVLWTANLTHSAADYTAEELSAMITQGKRADRALMDMPSYLFSELHPDDIAALVSYLKTLEPSGQRHPEPSIGPQLAKEIESGDVKDSVQWVQEMTGKGPPDIGPEYSTARSIARATCAECHGMDLRGSTKKFMDAPPPPNLRMVIAYSADNFATLMRTGKALGDRELKVMGGVARGRYSRFTEGEITALYGYLTELARRNP